ncbi:hypothetical protein [Thiothrix nivea]|nr:hypothetical protein [Thiothrix nivea]
MHSVAHSYYELAHSSGFRQKMMSNDDFFPFDLAQYDLIEKESSIIGMVMAWSVITLESIINQALAESLNDRSVVIEAIEHPNSVIKKFRIDTSVKSDLAKKIIILNDQKENIGEYIDAATSLSHIRNLIVHDKPFNLIYHGDGDVKIEHFRSRGEAFNKQLRYEYLRDFYAKCDKVLNFILPKISPSIINTHEIREPLKTPVPAPTMRK